MSTKIEDIFNSFWFEYYFLFLTNKPLVQTAGLNNLSAVQRLEAAVQYKMYGAYFELWIHV